VFAQPERGFRCFGCGRRVYDLRSLLDGGPWEPAARRGLLAAKQSAHQALRCDNESGARLALERADEQTVAAVSMTTNGGA
jgi:hypothetical protein